MQGLRWQGCAILGIAFVLLVCGGCRTVPLDQEAATSAFVPCSLEKSSVTYERGFTLTADDAPPVESVGEPAESGAGSEEDLAKTAQNPVGDLVSVPFQFNTTFNMGEHDRTQTVCNIQPVIPIPINSQWTCITRTILPVIWQPHIEAESGRTNGIGDLNPTFFFSPAKPGKVIWGVGPTFTLPTASNARLGSGKWGAGVSVVVLTMPGPWVIGALVSNTWSVAGNEDRADVNQMVFQYFVNYNFKSGWYLTSAPILTANWEAASGNVWTIPFGGGVGKIVKIGPQPVNISLAAFYNAVKPDTGGEWSIRFQAQWLFPNK